jgi:ribosomal protein S18 acetylase RimI-like enzyme
MIKILRRFFPLHLSDFTSYVTHSEYGYDKKRITYCDPTRNQEIGFIEYTPTTGKIHLFYITHERYKNRGLGPQILTTVLNDIKESGTTKVWLVTNIYPHPFWEKNNFIHVNHPHILLPVYTKQL